MDVDNNKHFLGVRIFLEIHDRLLGGKYGKIPTCISEDAFAQGGYCLDAPDELAAGAVESIEIEKDLWLPCQMTVYREGEVP